MNRIAVIYWSGTGNTQMMAEAVAQGAKDAGAEVTLLSVSDTDAAAASSYDALALGCPAMGGEVLEESEFEPFFSELEGKLSGKKVNPLIGSAGVSAVPMAARVSQMVGQKANPANFLLMHAMGPNVAGVIGSAIAAGFLLAVFG